MRLLLLSHSMPFPQTSHEVESASTRPLNVFILMGLFAFLFLTTVAVSAQELDANMTKKWMLAVEELLSAISLQPLKKEFTPSYLATRTQESVISMQASRFRAKTARAMVEATEPRVTVCVETPQTADAAVTIVYDELRALGYDVIWAKSDSSCQKPTHSALLITVPLPVVTPPAPAKPTE